MSLLIKALEQAAKDRDGIKSASTLPSSVATGATPEPTLEPPPTPRTRTPDAVTSPAANATADVTTSATRNAAPLSLDTAAPRRAAPPAAVAQIDTQHQRARAAAIVHTTGQSGHLFLSYFRGNPVAMIGACAAVFAAGFGIYVYLQIAQPNLFVRQAPLPRPNSAPQAVLSHGSQTAQSAAAPASTPNSAPAALSGTHGAPGETVSNAAPTQLAGSAGSAIQVIAAPIPTASVVGSSRAAEEKPAMSAERKINTRAEQDPARIKPADVREAPAASVAPLSSVREHIAVSSTTTQPRVNPILTQGYAALQSGNLEEARAAYTKLTQTEPLTTDAWLGLAYIATQENRSDDAMKLYLRILQINPRHAAAQAALIGLMGRADPLASETRLKQLISREPSAFLHFVLGNLYADQSLWPQAQQAYFQAHHLDPHNPDYAYNVAIGLDHLRQNRLALSFYRRAEQLAAANGRANFNLTHARERISLLSSQLD